MFSAKIQPYQMILAVIGTGVFVLGVVLFLVPPAVFPDPGTGFHVLRSMELGSSFNTLVTPDQDDISRNHIEFLTWWSPGQYLIPYLFKLIAPINLGQAIALTVAAGGVVGLLGFYYLFKKLGFTPLTCAISLVFIVCQHAFMVPYVFYNGGEILLFAFAGWFLYGCVAIDKPGVILLAFVLFSGWIGFFCKSSFMWIYVAGLCCLWIRLSGYRSSVWKWINSGIWLAIPAAMSVIAIYVFFLSKGSTPASASGGIRVTLQAFFYPLASPVLAGFSADDLVHGLIYHTGKSIFDLTWSIVILILLALCSILLIAAIIQWVQQASYKLLVLVFYIAAMFFFSWVYLRQLTISYEARHFRIIGLLIVPAVIELARKARLGYQIIFALVFIGIGYSSLTYLIKGYHINKNVNARGDTGIAQLYVDQPALNSIITLDKQNRNAIFVFVCNDLGLEIRHNRMITLRPIGDDLKINADDYRYDGHAGPLYIVLPESYNGPKEKMIIKSFQGYTGWNVSMLSDKYVLYSAK
jgi:hypothetical protein